MKATLALAIALVAVAVAGLVTGQALATNHARATTSSTLRVVMRDPGCHWFSIGGKFTTIARAKGAVRVVNLDEAALKVVGRAFTKRIPVGKQLVLRHGRYTITMVGQAADDNHLKLIVK